MKKITFTNVFLLIVVYTVAQTKCNNGLEIKTNLLNLVALGPSIGIEYNLKNDWTGMLSLASGKLDYGDFGVTNYKTVTLEYRKYGLHNTMFVGTYLKNIQKRVFRDEVVSSSTAIPFSIINKRDFIGNGLSAGATFGFKFLLYSNFSLELNSQIGVGRYYQMNDNTGNLPSGTYLDARLGLWLGFKF